MSTRKRDARSWALGLIGYVLAYGTPYVVIASISDGVVRYTSMFVVAILVTRLISRVERRVKS